MPEPHVHTPRIARAQALVKLERDRAARAAEVACRHERLAAQARPELRSLHVTMADLHRGIERRHQAAATPHNHHVERLMLWTAATPAAQDLEFQIGEGPVHDVATANHPVVADESTLPRRWPQFASAVARLGVRPVAAVPLTTGYGCLGALTVFDPLALPLLAGANNRAVVHQASGMVAVQLGCEADDALAILRARAFAENKTVAEIAHEVVSRKLKLG